MITVAVLGATGYTALEAIKILLRHPEAEIVAVTSRQEGRPPISSVHPSLVGRLDLELEDLEPEEVGRRADCVFGCLPHCASAGILPQVLAGGRGVVDFSADYRLDDADDLPRVVRPRASRRRPARDHGLRPAGTVPGADRDAAAGGQPRLLRHVGDPAAGPAGQGGAGRTRPTSSSTPRAASAGRAGRRS